MYTESHWSSFFSGGGGAEIRLMRPWLASLPLKTGVLFAKVSQMSEETKRITEAELLALFAKIEKEWPIRIELANLAGFKCSAKNPRALYETEFDLGIRDLYVEVVIRKPDNADLALQIVRNFYK